MEDKNNKFQKEAGKGEQGHKEGQKEAGRKHEHNHEKEGKEGKKSTAECGCKYF